MLQDYKVGRCSRRCFAQDRPLRPGEWFYSVVIEDDQGDLTRRDYSQEAWTEPPEAALGWWKGRMPQSGTRKLVLAPDAVLIDLLRQLKGDPERGELAYLMALLLLRRRVVRPLEGRAASEPGVLAVETIADGARLDVTEREIRPADAVRLRDELNELLYCEAE